MWEVLVPSERPSGTREVELQVPPGVLPFSFEDAPGWKRTTTKQPDGSLATVVWTGSTAGDGLATFRFLASTPSQAGELEWKAVQTYRDGSVARWIGSPDSENPASVTTVDAAAPRTNAGGESGPATAAGPSRVAPTRAAEAGGSDGLTRGLAIAALAIALGTAGLTLLGRRRGHG